jgi:hypothetical protein
MQTQDYILLIMNCEKYRHKAITQTSGWLKSIPANIKYFHVIGNEYIDKDFLFDHNAQILYVKTGDDYNSLPHKVIVSYLAVLMTFNFKYIFKTDDDQRLTDSAFFANLMIEIENKKPDYGGRKITIKQDHISEYYHYHPELPKNVLVKATNYCNGRFYILSRSAVLHILYKMDEIKKEYFEDYAIGYHMDETIKSNFLPIQNDVFVDF